MDEQIFVQKFIESPCEDQYLYTGLSLKAIS